MPISDIKAPAVNLIPVDPSNRMNQVAALQFWNKVITDYRNGDIVLDEKITIYKQTNDARVLALEQKVRLQPKLVEEGIRTLLQDPGFAQALAGSIGKVPGMDVTIGSVVKAFLEEPKVIEFHEHNDPVTGKLTGVTALVQVGEVVSTAVFTAEEAVDPLNANMLVFTLNTVSFAGTPASFRVWVGKLDKIIAVAAAGRPEIAITQYNREGLSAVVIDLAPKFSAAATVTLADLQAVDIDRDNLIGLDLPPAVRTALDALLAALDSRTAAVAAATAADTGVTAAQVGKTDAEAALAAGAAAIGSDLTNAQAVVDSAQTALTDATDFLALAQDGYVSAEAAVLLAGNVVILSANVSDKQAALDDAVSSGADQATLDGLQAELDAAVLALAAGNAALADANNGKTVAEAAVASAQADVDAATLAKAAADAALAAVSAPLAALQLAVDDATADLSAANALKVEQDEAVAAATTNAQARLVTFNSLKIENGITADYGLPNYTV
jgi:hypothetical protein